MRRLLLPLLLLSAVVTPAQTAPEAVVYVTKAGEKYHRKTCAQIRRSKVRIGMTIKEAREKRFTPCKVCKPG